MNDEAEIDRILERCEQLQSNGQDVSIEELCSGRPDLVAEVKRRFDALEYFDHVLNAKMDGDLLLPESPQKDDLSESPTESEVVRAEATYHLERLLAAGGLGTVFLARNAELGREVALKIIRARGSRSDRVQREFMREAEITGLLEHPGVVPIYDLGIDPKGSPFYAMRRVRGTTLDQCIRLYHGEASAGLSASERGVEFNRLLRRFISVCNTVGYAHSLHIVHQDIKPLNIMVGEYDETIVVDWGLARRLPDSRENGGQSGKPDGTRSGQTPARDDTVVGTPAYMSPERMQWPPRDVGEASDIYSLGATLYAILTGHAAFDEKRISELLANVRRGSFPPPRSWRPEIPRSLEAICLKAMARVPEERYASARELAAEVERFLADEPVLARPEPLWARAQRWMRRHKTLVTTAIASVVVALIGTAAVLLVLRQANLRLRNSNVALERANVRERERFDLALDAIRTFHGEVSQELLLKEKPFSALRTKLLSGAAGFYQKLEGMLQRESDTASVSGLAQAYEELGNITSQIGQKTAALAIHKRGLSVRRYLVARPDAGPQAHTGLARSLLATGHVQEEMGNTSEALVSYSEAANISRALAADYAGVSDVRAALGQSLLREGWLLFHVQRPAEGRKALEEARDLFEGLRSQSDASDDYQEDLGESYYHLSYVLRQLGEAQLARTSFERSRDIFQSLADADPASSPRFRTELAACEIQLGSLLRQMRDMPSALVSFNEAKIVLEDLARAYPNVAKFRAELARSYGNIGIVHRIEGRLAEASAALEQARSLQRDLTQSDPRVVSFQSDLANTYTQLGELFKQMKKIPDAIQSHGEAFELQKKLVASNPGIAQFQAELAASLGFLGALYEETGHLAEAIVAYKNGAASLERLPLIGPVQKFNLCCFHARLAGIARFPAAGISAEEARGHADIAMKWLRESVNSGFRNFAIINGEADLDPLRNREDFRLLLLDLGFPSDVFAR